MGKYQDLIEIPEDDKELLELCDIQTFCSSGSGGQHVNRTNSAVRLVFRPCGIAVVSQQERSQYLNKMLCLKKLREKISRLNYRKPTRIPTSIPFHKKQKAVTQKKEHSKKKSLRSKKLFQDEM